MKSWRRGAGFCLLLAGLLPGCREEAVFPCDGPEGARPAAAPSGFVDRTEGSGIDFVNHTGSVRDKVWIVEAKGGGVLALDYDGDGRIDLYAIDGNSCRLDGEGRVVTRTADPAAGNRLYRNLGGFRFEDVTASSGLGDRGYGFGGTVGDYDGDGRPDVYVCNWGRNRLYRNLGDDTFADVAAAAGVEGPEDAYSTGAAFLDADGDGDLDLYVANYADVECFMRRTRGRGVVPDVRGRYRIAGPRGIPPQADVLYRNEGDGTFTDVGATALSGQVPGYTFTPVVADFDRDGDSDVYVTADLCRNHLWINDGSGRFEDRAILAGAAVGPCGERQAGMGCDAGDYDQDGDTDLFVTNFLEETNSLYRNLTGEVGSLFFEEVATRSPLGAGDFMKVCWATKFEDFDLDGWLDLFVVAGHFYDVERFADCEGAPYRQKPSLWLAEGPPAYGFRAPTPAEAGPGLAVPKVGRGAVFADLDDDGDVDVFLSALNDRPLLLENRLPRRGSWLAFALDGPGANRSAIGARVTVDAGGGRIRQTRELRLGGGFLGANDPRLHFGLGAADRADRVEVRWPNGAVDTFTDLPANRLWHLSPGRPPRVNSR